MKTKIGFKILIEYDPANPESIDNLIERMREAIDCGGYANCDGSNGLIIMRPLKPEENTWYGSAYNLP